MKLPIPAVLLLLSMPLASALAQSPAIYSQDGKYLGNLNENRFDPNSVANPYGTYGSPYSPTSINNQYGTYGSKYSPQGAENPYGGANSPVVIGSDGTYLGHANANRYDPDSISNPYGRFGSQYSPTSVRNPYSLYGSPYSPSGATNQYGTGSAVNPMDSYGWRYGAGFNRYSTVNAASGGKCGAGLNSLGTNNGVSSGAKNSFGFRRSF